MQSDVFHFDLGEYSKLHFFAGSTQYTVSATRVFFHSQLGLMWSSLAQFDMLICSLASNMQLSGTIPDLLSNVTTLKYVDLGECSVFSPKLRLEPCTVCSRLEYALWILISFVRFVDTAPVVCSPVEPFLGSLRFASDYHII